MRWIAAAALLLSCAAAPEHPTPADYESACGWYRAHGCLMGEPTPDGATCEEVIANAAVENIDLTGPWSCIEAAQTCDQAYACAPK